MHIRPILEYVQKKRKKVSTIHKKMEILTNFENGMKNWEICKKYNVQSCAIQIKTSLTTLYLNGLTNEERTVN